LQSGQRLPADRPSRSERCNRRMSDENNVVGLVNLLNSVLGLVTGLLGGLTGGLGGAVPM